MSIIFSCVIPTRDPENPLCKDLIASIKAQDFPQDKIEILTITEGDSEQAKAIGIRKAKGAICVMLCDDNIFPNNNVFGIVYYFFKLQGVIGVYSRYYGYLKNDNSLNRYFSLIGGNDPICFYLGKNDRKPYYELTDSFYDVMFFKDEIPSLGCNGTFIYRKAWIDNADLDHYYPMDCALDVVRKVDAFWIRQNVGYVVHRTTDGNLIRFLTKRYRYARDLYCKRNDRRWRMLDTKEDFMRLALFIFFTLTLIQPLYTSIRGFRKIRDFAWFWHPIVCLGFLITYGILCLMSAWSYLLSVVQNLFKDVSKA